MKLTPVTGGPIESLGTVLRSLLHAPRLTFAMEAHNALAARIVEHAGFEILWASGFAISTALGLRDRNEVSVTQLVDVLQLMRDVTDIPILVDADTGFGDFNNFRLLVRRLSGIGVAGACIEDKTFPKLNSFVAGRQSLASIEEFCGKIQAARDLPLAGDFCIVARTEALVVGATMQEALHRAEAYRRAGADAILIHSKAPTAEQIISFAREWANRCPLVIVPTTYGDTPTDRYEAAGISTVIWANHLIRASIAAMRGVCARIASERAPGGVRDSIVTMEEVFALFDYGEVVAAEKRYLPNGAAG